MKAIRLKKILAFLLLASPYGSHGQPIFSQTFESNELTKTSDKSKLPSIFLTAGKKYSESTIIYPQDKEVLPQDGLGYVRTTVFQSNPELENNPEYREFLTIGPITPLTRNKKYSVTIYYQNGPNRNLQVDSLGILITKDHPVDFLKKDNGILRSFSSPNMQEWTRSRNMYFVPKEDSMRYLSLGFFGNATKSTEKKIVNYYFDLLEVREEVGELYEHVIFVLDISHAMRGILSRGTFSNLINRYVSPLEQKARINKINAIAYNDTFYVKSPLEKVTKWFTKEITNDSIRRERILDSFHWSRDPTMNNYGWRKGAKSALDSILEANEQRTLISFISDNDKDSLNVNIRQEIGELNSNVIRVEKLILKKKDSKAVEDLENYFGRVFGNYYPYVAEIKIGSSKSITFLNSSFALDGSDLAKHVEVLPDIFKIKAEERDWSFDQSLRIKIRDLGILSKFRIFTSSDGNILIKKRWRKPKSLNHDENKLTLIWE